VSMFTQGNDCVYHYSPIYWKQSKTATGWAAMSNHSLTTSKVSNSDVYQ